jgi:hypothetical protein
MPAIYQQARFYQVILLSGPADSGHLEALIPCFGNFGTFLPIGPDTTRVG